MSREAWNAYMRAWRAKNREQYLESERERHKRRPKRVLTEEQRATHAAEQRARRAADPEAAREYARQYRREHPEMYREAARRQRAPLQELLRNIKLERGCTDCGSIDINRLQFHHVDPSTKAFTLGNTAEARDLEAIIAEIRKCVVLCDPCHRSRHSRRKATLSEQS